MLLWRGKWGSLSLLLLPIWLSFSCLEWILRPPNPALGRFPLQIQKQYWFRSRAFLAEQEGGGGGCRMEPEGSQKGLVPGHFSVPAQPLTHTCENFVISVLLLLNNVIVPRIWALYALQSNFKNISSFVSSLQSRAGWTFCRWGTEAGRRVTC